MRLISATTKSGGRQFHGTAYEFLRNEALDARDPLAATKSKLRLNQFGGNVSGPIPLWGVSSLKDPKLFFFFNMEVTRGNRPNGGPFVDVAHPDILNGDFRRLLRSTTLAGSSCLYPGETAARPCQQGTVFRPGTVVRNAQGNIIGGQPYPNNTVPQSEWNQNAPAFLKLIGALDRTGGVPVTGSPELVRVFAQDQYRLRKRQEVVRVDYNLSSKTNFFFRWVDDSQDEDMGVGIFNASSFPYTPQFRKKPGSSWSWNLVNVISPTVTNEFIFGYNHLTQVVDIPDGVDKNLYDRDALGFKFKELYPDANLRNRYPRFNCGIGGCNFPGFANNWESEARQFAWTDNLTIVKNAHTYKTGVFFNMNRNGQQPAWTDSINLNFGPSANNPRDTGNTFANMLLGNYTSVNQSNGKFFGSFRFYGLEFFGQDSWKATRRLTLEFGARYAYLGPTFTTGDLLQNYFFADKYDPAKAVRIETANGPTNGSIITGSGDPFNGMIEEGNGIPSGGVALFDYDNDGWLDIYLVNGSTFAALQGKEKPPRAALFHNNKDGTFTDVTTKAGVANERWGFGVAAGDYDNDGWEDFYLTNFGRNRLYHNNGDGTFTDVAEKIGAAIEGWSTGATFGDYDGDGDLDLFVAGYVAFDPSNPPEPRTTKDGQKYCHYRGQPVMCGPRGLEGAPDHLLRNDGGKFTDVGKQAGVADEKGYYGFGAAFCDIDDDGRLDLMVANDSTPKYLYLNKGGGVFEDVSFVSGFALNEDGREQAAMGLAVGDYDNDGKPDLYVTNFSDDTNTLYHNEGEALFNDVTFASGHGTPTIPFLGWGVGFIDFDNDGLKDVFVANGHVYPQVDEYDWGTTWAQRPLLFKNKNGKTFDLAPAATGSGLAVVKSARGAAFGDLDNDGRVDVVLNNCDDAPTVLRNVTKEAGHWLTLKLIGGPKSPRDAIGATAWLTAGGERQRADVISGASYCSQSDLRPHFGLGKAAKVDKLEIRWPSGARETVEVKVVDRMMTVTENPR